MYDWSLYFIGKNCLERRSDFTKSLDKIEDKIPYSGIDTIQYLDGRPDTEAIFKSFDQMVFEGKDDIIKYIDNWKKNIPRYNEYGMIPKLSVLLYGDPGVGKSTFCKALAKYLDIHVIRSLSPQYFDNEENLNKQAGNTNHYTDAIYSIDDIDTVCSSREEDSSKDNNKVISSLLDFLDNPPSFYYKADDGKYYLVSIVCATTNYIDRLDKAVKRSGRFDLKIEMKKFDRKEAQMMCDIYGLKLEDIYKDEINDDTTFVPAHIQALCTENIDNNLKTV
jgi:SpoVK/Ycf46/Vps4 family AAA+-type ATPase